MIFRISKGRLDHSTNVLNIKDLLPHSDGRAIDSCFALVGAHQYGKYVLMDVPG